jgi:hypothetical protein
MLSQLNPFHIFTPIFIYIYYYPPIYIYIYPTNCVFSSALGIKCESTVTSPRRKAVPILTTVMSGEGYEL